MGSILTEIKQQLSLPADDASFDPELIIHINSVLSEFNQLGIGPETGFFVAGENETWEEFLGTDARYNVAKSLAFLKIKMLFDPPQVGYVLTSYEKMIDRMEWRLNVHREFIVHPMSEDSSELDEPDIIMDGGTF